MDVLDQDFGLIHCGNSGWGSLSEIEFKNGEELLSLGKRISILEQLHVHWRWNSNQLSFRASCVCRWSESVGGESRVFLSWAQFGIDFQYVRDGRW